jgi:hypothetical protein
MPFVTTVEQPFDRLRSLRSCLRLRCKRTIRTLDQLAVLPNGPLPSPFGSWVALDIKGVRVGTSLLLGHAARMPQVFAARHPPIEVVES